MGGGGLVAGGLHSERDAAQSGVHTSARQPVQTQSMHSTAERLGQAAAGGQAVMTMQLLKHT